MVCISIEIYLVNNIKELGTVVYRADIITELGLYFHSDILLSEVFDTGN